MKTKARRTQRCDSREPAGLRSSGTQPLPPWATGTEEKGVIELRSGVMGRDYISKREVEAGVRIPSLLALPSVNASWGQSKVKRAGRGDCENPLVQGTTEEP